MPGNEPLTDKRGLVDMRELIKENAEGKKAEMDRLVAGG